MSCSTSSTGTSARDALDQVADPLALGGGQAGQRLVEQQQRAAASPARATCRAGAARRTTAAPASASSMPARPIVANHGGGLRVHAVERVRASARTTKRAGSRACTASRTFSPTLKPANRLVIWNERPMPARVIALRRQPGDRPARKRHRAAIGTEHAGDQVEGRGLAGAVRPDQRMQRAVGEHGEVDAAHRLDAAEALGESTRFEHRGVGPVGAV